ncbi:hypothetical protein NDK47_12615 [Brevibacillus ruminantium]|uniref:Uncharacterized protein n=1 Tax=Brevibacillus ruminantium TaxID=2950604 RepID=A0ABY4WTZ1_9BACL|nr:hypothetical protein [Brevibacillus ruminantium]USG68066.1 hypothetical protein NDK47_12615 [Brevibacillus ruminantium]
MITVRLLGTAPFHHTISYSVSPLFELASSLHLLTQAPASGTSAGWAEQMLQDFQTERIMEEWKYFLPLFEDAIPAMLDPIRTSGVMSVEEQFSYFVEMPTATFQASLQTLINKPDREPGNMLALDAIQDADFVKGRFSLFLSSYWQLFFAETWEKIAPLFVREAEQIFASLHSPEACISFLQKIAPPFSYDQERQELQWDDRFPEEIITEQLILHPSYFFPSTTLLKREQSIHLIYPIET